MTDDDDRTDEYLETWPDDEDDEETPEDRDAGQFRMANRLAAEHKGELLYVHRIGWHHWDGTRWADDDAGTAERMASAIIQVALHEAIDHGDTVLRADATRCESATGLHGVLACASSMPAFSARVSDMDADPYLLNTAAGTLDLRAMALQRHDPADRITKCTRAAYLTDEPAPVWERFLERVLPDEPVRFYLQRLMGVALLGKVIEHVWAIATGTGANGKTTFYKAVCWALGDYAATAEPELFIHRDNAMHPTGQMDLFGRRLVIVSEIDEGRRLAEATVKRLTGGDLIKARYMRRDFVQFVPSHLPIMVTNHLPAVSDDTAVWRRLRVIPFDVSIPAAEQDKTLDEALQLEADGILSWAIAGWADYQARSGLDEPAGVLLATDDYRRSSDIVGRFIEDCRYTGLMVKATTTDLHGAYVRWAEAEANGEPMGRGRGER